MKKINNRTLLGYSIAGLGDNGSYSFIGSFLHFYLTSVAGLSAAGAGIVTSAGAIWNAVMSPAVGYISDKSENRYGRRRPFILAGTLMLAGSLPMLFLTLPNLSMPVRTVYYTAMALLFWTGYSTFFTPWLALGAELTDDYHERTRLRSWTSTFNILGGIVGQVAPVSLVALLVAAGFSTPRSWYLAALMVALLVLFSAGVTWNSTRGQEPACFGRKRPAGGTGDGKASSLPVRLERILREYGQVLRLKPLKYLAAGSILYLVANTFIMTGRMYYVTCYMEFSGFQVTLVYLYTAAIGVLVIPLIRRLSLAVGKRMAFVITMLIAASAGLFFGLSHMESPAGLYGYLLFLWIGVNGYWQMFPSMIYDVCEVDELRYGARREGTVVSILSLSESLSAALAVMAFSGILERAGFQGGVEQTEAARNWMLYNFTLIPAVFMLLAAIMVLLYPVTEKRYRLVCEALALKRAGQKYAKEGLDRVL